MSTSSTTRGTGPRRTAGPDGDRAFAQAWRSMWFFLLSFAASFVAFVILWAALGYKVVYGTGYPANLPAPTGLAGPAIWLLLTALYVWPLVFVIRHAREAKRLGHPDWRWPVIIGGVIAGLMPVANYWLLLA